MLRESADEALIARVLRQRDGAVPEQATLSRTVVRRVMRERVAILATDTATDPHLVSSDSIASLNVRSFMCAPLTGQDEVIGVLYVDSPHSARFSAADLEVFTALANAAAVAIEQARLSSQLQEELRRRERLLALSLAGRRQPHPAGRVRRRRRRRAGARCHRDVLRHRGLHDPVRAAAAPPRPRRC